MKCPETAPYTPPLDCSAKSSAQVAMIEHATTTITVCDFHPLCTSALRRLYFVSVSTYVANPLHRHTRDRSQKVMPSGRAVRRSSEVGCSRIWKDNMIALATVERYMDTRSQERKVRSLAQWSRASEALFSKTSGPKKGLERKMGPERALSLLFNPASEGEGWIH